MTQKTDSRLWEKIFFSLPSITQDSMKDCFVSRYAHVKDGNKVLHLGCGSGALLSSIAHKTSCLLYGTTNDALHMKSIRDRLPAADVVYTDPDDIPWQNIEFDAIITTSPTAGQTRTPDYLQEILKHLRTGGQFIMLLAWHPRLLGRLFHQTADAITGQSERADLSRSDAIALLKSTGFTSVTWHAVKWGSAVITGYKRDDIKP